MITHVGIYIGNGKMIHDAGTENNPECVKIGEIHTSYLKFNCIRNLLD
ncbi:NlpC/P60 family protein [Peptostreptococcus porci]